MEQCIAGVLMRLDSEVLQDKDPTPPFITRLNVSKSGCVDSGRFHSIEDAGNDLCQFLKAMTGVSFEYQ